MDFQARLLLPGWTRRSAASNERAGVSAVGIARESNDEVRLRPTAMTSIQYGRDPSRSGASSSEECVSSVPKPAR